MNKCRELTIHTVKPTIHTMNCIIACIFFVKVKYMLKKYVFCMSKNNFKKLG